MKHATAILDGKTASAVTRAAEELSAGGLVGLPTETVYGLACDALNPQAVASVFAAKRRPSFDPLIVHARDLAHAITLGAFDDTAAALADRFWPGPMTLVVPRQCRHDGEPTVPDLVTAGLARVGLRVPAHPVAQAVLRASGLALAAPSANRFGAISPTTAQHVADGLAGDLGLVLDGGRCSRGVESTVLSIQDGGVAVLRLGAIPVEQIEQALPGVAVTVRRPTSAPGRSDETTGPLPAPGMTDRHYAPNTPLLWVDDLDAWNPPETTGPGRPRNGWALITLGEPRPDDARFTVARSLSLTGDLNEAAANLFACMRELDGLGMDGLLAVTVPEQGLGRAINDRLRRAGNRG